MKFTFILLFFFILVQAVNAQVGIGASNPDSSAMLELRSNNRGFLPPRMTTSQILSIKRPKAGLIVYNTSQNVPVFFNGTVWKFFCGDSTLTAPNLSNGLVAYFPFTGDFNDKSGKGNNGLSLGGASLTTNADGVSNAALNCDGSGQKLVVNNNGSIRFDTALTVSFDLLVRSSGRFHFVNMASNADGSGASFGVGTNLPGNSSLAFSAVDSNASCFTTSPSTTNLVTNFSFSLNKWYTVICIFNKGVMKVYLNGSLILNVVSSSRGLRVCNNSQLIIGGWWNGDPQGSMNGKIDEVRVYNKELSVTEIEELSGKFL